MRDENDRERKEGEEEDQERREGRGRKIGREERRIGTRHDL